jgi:ABC-type sugar transport system ATPase subunit
VVLIPDEVPEIYVHAWRILVIRQGQQPAAM